MELPVKILNPNAILPFKKHKEDAGNDLCACIDKPITILPGDNCLIGTGVAVAVPEGYFGGIFARSGLANDEHLRPANCIGVVDSNYRGEVKVSLHNDGNIPRIVKPGERIAQLIVMPYLPSDCVVVDDLDATDRGIAGFGSTGKF